MVYSWLRKPKFLVFIPLVLLLVIALACGEDATSTPRPTNTPAPPPPTATTAAPAPAPTATTAPAAPAATRAPGAPAPTATKAPAAPAPTATKAAEPTAIPTPTPLPPPTQLGPPTPTAAPVKAELEPVYGGILTEAQIANCDSFDPHRGRSVVSLSCSAPLYSNLLEYDPIVPGVLICDVCTDFSASPDGKAFTFNIRKGIKFTDGVELTAEDVAFSVNRWVEGDFPRPNTATANAHIDRVTVDGPYTVTIHTKAVAPSFLRNIGRDFFKVLPKHWVEAGNDPHIATNAMGSGPFMLVRFRDAVSHESERNPNYFREGLPYLEGVKSFILTDPGTELAAYTTERVLFTHHTQQGIPSLNRLATNNGFLSKFDIWWQPGINGVHLIVNTQKPPFDNPKVREAINLALHRQPILATIGGGRFGIGKPMGPNNPFALTDEEILERPGYRELNGKKHPDDIARARQLWADAGFSASNKLVAIINSPDSKPHPDLAQVYKAQMEEVLEHVDITFTNLELGAWASHMRTGPYDMSASGKGSGISDPDDRFSQLYLTGARNWARQQIDGVQELFDAQSKELDSAKRRTINEEMQRLVLNNFPGTMEVAWETQAIFAHKKIMTKTGQYVLSAGRENAMQLYHLWLLPETPDRPAFGADPGFGGN